MTRRVEKAIRRSYDSRYLQNDPPLRWYVQLPGAAEDDCPHYTTRQRALTTIMRDLEGRETERLTELQLRRLSVCLFPAGQELANGRILPGTTPGGAMLCKAVVAKQWESARRIVKRNVSIWGGLDVQQKHLVLGQGDSELLGFGIELSNVASIDGDRRDWARTIVEMLLDREVKL